MSAVALSYVSPGLLSLARFKPPLSLSSKLFPTLQQQPTPGPKPLEFLLAFLLFLRTEEDAEGMTPQGAPITLRSRLLALATGLKSHSILNFASPTIRRRRIAY